MSSEPDVNLEVREENQLPADVTPDITNLVIRDDTPVESIFADLQYHLLVESLYNSWLGPGEGRTFMVLANVALFATVEKPPVVPDVMLSLDVPTGLDLKLKENNSYYIWRFGKAPDVVIEVVSDQRGGEDSAKKRHYARLGVPYYIIYDPRRVLSEDVLRCHVLVGRSYQPLPENWFQDVGLGIRLWEGVYAGQHAVWLRWCDERGDVIPTGQERANKAQEKAEKAQEKANKAQEKAEKAQEKAEKAQKRTEQMEAKLRELGIDPATLTEKQP